MAFLKLSLSISLMIFISLTPARSADVDKTVEETQISSIVNARDKTKTAVTEADKKVIIQKTKENQNDRLPLNLASIDVTGVKDKLKKNIELHIPVTIPECNADRGDIKLFFTAVKKNLRKATRALGYYDAEFTSGGSIVDNCWKLRLKVTAGRPTKVVAQEIKVVGDGRNDKIFKTILKKYPYKIGDVLNHQLYSSFKTKLSEASQTLGYFDAEFDQHTIRIDPVTYQAKVALVLNTGPRYSYADVTVEQTILSDKAIEKYLIIKSGEPFKAEDLINQQQILQRSGYYKTIKIEAKHEEITNKKIPILITLTPKKRNAYKFKLGFGSDTGARVSAELDRRWTGSRGRKLLIKTQYAETLSVVSLQLVNPRDNPEDNSLVYNIDFTKDSNDDVSSRSINVGVRRIRKRESGWIQTASVNALRDQTQVVEEDETQSTLLLFSVGLEKVSADSLIFPKDGWRIKFDLTGAAEVLLSDQNLVQFTAQVKRVIPFGSGRLLGRANYGTTVVNDFDSLPISLRFFAGGSNSVRGFDFESLGELNDNNRNRGGRQLIDLSLEYQHPISKSWDGALFVDVGNAFDDFDDVDLQIGLGFGARWRSPVGPVRIDLGFPHDDVSDVRLFLSVGSDL